MGTNVKVIEINQNFADLAYLELRNFHDSFVLGSASFWLKPVNVHLKTAIILITTLANLIFLQ